MRKKVHLKTKAAILSVLDGVAVLSGETNIVMNNLSGIDRVEAADAGSASAEGTDDQDAGLVNCLQ